MRIGVLTGGGDCPGLNAVIRAIVRKGINESGHRIFGFRHGWRGVLEADQYELTLQNTRGILHRGGTILGTSRTNPLKEDGGLERIQAQLAITGVEALIAIGGEDTLGVAGTLAEAGVRVVGVPKTIDNDLSATEVTFGFDTAVQVATEAIDRLHTTAESHDRILVCEVMGRHAGWIALWSGIAGGADEILIPERAFDIDDVCAHLRHRHAGGANFSIVVVAEGASPVAGSFAVSDAQVDQFGHVRLGGIGALLALEIEARTGFETRVTILGHIQRGGTPTAFDRVLATRFGVAAVEAVDAAAWGEMVALRCGDIVRVPLAEATGTLKTVDDRLYDLAKVFFRVIFAEQPERVLAIYAHPDDAETACGGSLARWAAAGADVRLCLLTRGDKGVGPAGIARTKLAARRRDETAAAAAALGVRGVVHLDHPDGSLIADETVLGEIVGVVREVHPDLVCCPDPTPLLFGDRYVNHHDHRVTGAAVLDALAWAAPNPNYFPGTAPPHQVPMVLLSGTLEPSAWVDVADVLDTKVAAIACHASQLGEGGDSFAEWLPARAAETGRPVGLNAAEAFRLVRLG